MKYIVSRTSNSGIHDDPEVKGAKKETLLYHYLGIKKNLPLVQEDIPARDEPKERWTIEFNSLEELNSFCVTYDNPVIIFPPDRNGEGFGLLELEIYDSYRE